MIAAVSFRATFEPITTATFTTRRREKKRLVPRCGLSSAKAFETLFWRQRGDLRFAGQRRTNFLSSPIV